MTIRVANQIKDTFPNVIESSRSPKYGWRFTIDVDKYFYIDLKCLPQLNVSMFFSDKIGECKNNQDINVERLKILKAEQSVKNSDYNEKICNIYKKEISFIRKIFQNIKLYIENWKENRNLEVQIKNRMSYKKNMGKQIEYLKKCRTEYLEDCQREEELRKTLGYIASC